MFLIFLLSQTFYLKSFCVTKDPMKSVQETETENLQSMGMVRRLEAQLVEATVMGAEGQHIPPHRRVLRCHLQWLSLLQLCRFPSLIRLCLRGIC